MNNNITKYLTALLGITLFIIPAIFSNNLYLLHIIITCLIWGVVAAAWDLIMGYAGVFTFGQLAFFAIGSYTSGMLTVYTNTSPWIGMIAGGVMAALVGLIIGIPCLRLKGVYIALITFALHMILDPFVKEARDFGTGGSMGLLGVPPLKFFNYTFGPMDRVQWYYATLIISLILLAIIYKIIKSNMGLAFTALRDDPKFAESLGVNAYKYKLLIFSVSAFITGVIGAFYVHYMGMVSSKILGLDIFLIVMMMIIIGGVGRFPGAFLGAFAVTILNELLRPFMMYRMLVFGAIVILLVILMPNGMMGLIDSTKSYFSRKNSKSEKDHAKKAGNPV